MKILKEGRRPENSVYQAECKSCHTEIEFARYEAKVVFDQRDGDYLEIACPLCGDKITRGVAHHIGGRANA